MSLKAPKFCLQGGGSDEAVAHAMGTDNVAMPAPAVHDCLSVRAAKNVRELRLRNGA